MKCKSLFVALALNSKVVKSILILIVCFVSNIAYAQLEGKNQISAGLGVDFFSVDYSRYFGEANRHAVEVGFIANKHRYYDKSLALAPLKNQAELLYKYTVVRSDHFDFNVGTGIRSGDGIVYPTIPVLVESQYWLPDNKASIKVRVTTLLHGTEVDPVMQILPSLGFAYRF